MKYSHVWHPSAGCQISFIGYALKLCAYEELDQKDSIAYQSAISLIICATGICWNQAVFLCLLRGKVVVALGVLLDLFQRLAGVRA